IQFGADYVRLAPERRDATGSVSVIADRLGDLDLNKTWIANAAPRRVAAVLTEVSLFAEDTWRVTSRLTATYGLRWEITPSPGETTNILDPLSNSVNARDDRPRPIWRSTYEHLAPRFGVAYRLRQGGRTVIRAGAG